MMTTSTRSAAMVFFGGISYLVLTAFSGGITGRTQKNGTGCNCHGSLPSGAITVQILGPDVLTVGQTGTYTVTISGGPLSSAGTNVAASSGELKLLAGEGLQQLGDELTHTAPKLPQQESVSFAFSYTAPATPGMVTLYANGNSVNLSGDPTGDQWNFAPDRPITVTGATSVPGNDVPPVFTLAQNYPNPFNPSTTIEFALAERGLTRLEVFTPSGVRIRTLVAGELPAGLHRYVFDASTLASGVYIYRLISGAQRSTGSMVLVR